MYMESEESEEASGMPISVSRDRKSKWIGASVVTRKGNCPYAIKRLSEDLVSLGYSKRILKYDPEPAIMDLKSRVKMERPEEIIMEESPAYEHRSNGEVERAIQTVQGQIRALKSGVESRYRESLSSSSNLVPWMVRHAGNLINMYHKGQDVFI